MKFTTSYFHMKTKTLADFQIYIGVPLRVSFNASKKLERYNKVIPKLYALFYSQICTHKFRYTMRLEVLNYFSWYTRPPLVIILEQIKLRKYTIQVTNLSFLKQSFRQNLARKTTLRAYCVEFKHYFSSQHNVIL